MGKTAEIFILIGQSNADGRAAMAELPADIAAFYAAEPGNLRIYHKETVRRGCGVDPASFNTQGAWWRLGPGHDAARRMTNQVVDNGNVHFGCELSYAQAHAEAQPDTPLWIVKAAVGGSFIENDWGITNADPDKMWTWFRDHVYAPARAAIVAQGLTPRIGKVFWMQGESDTNPQDAPLYEARLRMLVERLNTELAEKPELIVLGGLSATYNATAHGRMVKAAQKAVAASCVNTILLPTDGSDGRPALELRDDRIHYGAQGMRDMGRRVYEAGQPLRP